MTETATPKKHLSVRPGLDEDAYSKARRLYEATGDIRYAVIAIGKTRGDRVGWPDGMPEWAIEACQRFAEVVRNATPIERRRLGVQSRLPRQSANENLYRKIVEAVKKGAPDFASACRAAGIVDASVIRNLRRKFNKDLNGTPLGAPIAERHQRLLEEGEARVRVTRRLKASDGQNTDG